MLCCCCKFPREFQSMISTSKLKIWINFTIFGIYFDEKLGNFYNGVFLEISSRPNFYGPPKTSEKKWTIYYTYTYTQARVQRGAQGAWPPPLEIEKQKKKKKRLSAYRPPPLLRILGHAPE